MIWFVANRNRFSAVSTKAVKKFARRSALFFFCININFKIAFASTVIEFETLFALAVLSVILLFYQRVFN